MTDDVYDKIGPLLAEIGREGARIVGGKTDGLYIYIEVEDSSVYGAVFTDEGAAVRYYDPSSELCDIVREAWETTDRKKARRWIVMEYEVKGTKFDAQFRYKEELNPDDYSSDRRQVALEKRYGDKPIIYPPIPEHLLRAQ